MNNGKAQNSGLTDTQTEVSYVKIGSEVMEVLNAWRGLSLWGPGDSPGYPNLPNSKGGDEWTKQGARDQEGAGHDVYQNF